VSYPWAVFLGDPKSVFGGNADNAAVTDVEVLGAWNGVAAVSAHRHYIARVQGHPLNIGLFVDATYDIGRIEDVHFNPWFSAAKPFIYYQTNNGRAFVFGRSDWEYVFNTFAFGYAIGYHFIDRQTGSMNGNFLGIGMDLATNASVQVDQSQPMGLLITNGEFTAFCDTDHSFCEGPGSDRNPSQVVVGPANVGAVKFVNSAFWGPTAQIARTDGKGAVTFSQCHFENWDNHLDPTGTKYLHNGTAAIQQLGGSLVVTDCDFSAGKTQIQIGPFANKSIITNNLVTGILDIENQSKGKVIIANNADDSK